MPQKTIIISLLLFTSSILYSIDNLSLSIKHEYANILKLGTENINANINSKITSTIISWTQNTVNFKGTVSYKNSGIDISGIETDSLDPINVKNSSIKYNKTLLYPSFYLGIDKSWISLSLKEDLDLEINLVKPFSNGLDLGVNHTINHPLKKIIDILGSYEIRINPQITTSSLFFDFHQSGLNLGLSASAITIINKPNLNTEESIGINLITKNNLQVKGYTGYDSNILKMEISGEYSKFIIDETPMYLFKKRALIGGTINGSSLEIISTQLETSFNNLSISILHSTYNIKATEIFIETGAFIYGNLAYKHYNFYIPDITIYRTGGKCYYTFIFSFMKLGLGLEYNRFYTDFKGIEYGYKELIWTLFSPSVIYKSSLLDTDLFYDHLNLIKIHLNSQFYITDSISIIGSLNQLIPFFDINLSNSASNFNNITSSSNSYTITGGTTFSLEFKLEL